MFSISLPSFLFPFPQLCHPEFTQFGDYWCKKKKKKNGASDRNKITERSVFWELGGVLLPLLAEAVDLPSHDLYNYDSKTKKVRMKKLFIRK